ncbi:hypothetical protein D0N36_14885 [Hymenobacter lapidiphilus]|uniref:hypothetical protein n=1 Tax=Hymenobacter sp. CCM 8763 TaxID=2303334 RepID=UPI000E34B3E9|nr:hypothetical protein [Hymenobacter sp. CCM 8763]RFP64337.1 hypothetical protein D0N36_14885 [Hymenobacter sp. CCM 8763]
MLGAAALLASSPTVQAQDFVPTSYDVTTSQIYTRPVEEQYRRHKVRTVLVQQQQTDERRRDVMPGFTVASFQECDGKGRVVRQYWAQAGRLGRRMDLTYAANDELRLVASFSRLPDPADTTRLGQVWLPASCTHYPLMPGTGIAALWNELNGDWEPYERSRTWKQRDTTYLATSSYLTGKLKQLSRTYYVGPGEKLWRQDKLTFNDYGLREVAYEYIKLNGKQVLEMGQLDFRKAFIDYVAAHPEAGPLKTDEPTQWQDDLARHTKGLALPQFTQTYDASGGVSTSNGYGRRSIFKRNERGQLLESQHYVFDELIRLTKYTYLPNGLLDRLTSYDKQGEKTGTAQYRYGFYYAGSSLAGPGL